MSILDRKLRRDLKARRSQFVVITIIIGMAGRAGIATPGAESRPTH